LKGVVALVASGAKQVRNLTEYVTLSSTIEQFLQEMWLERGLSDNTLAAY